MNDKYGVYGVYISHPRVGYRLTWSADFLRFCNRSWSIMQQQQQQQCHDHVPSLRAVVLAITKPSRMQQGAAGWLWRKERLKSARRAGRSAREGHWPFVRWFLYWFVTVTTDCCHRAEGSVVGYGGSATCSCSGGDATGSGWCLLERFEASRGLSTSITTAPKRRATRREYVYHLVCSAFVAGDPGINAHQLVHFTSTAVVAMLISCY